MSTTITADNGSCVLRNAIDVAKSAFPRPSSVGVPTKVEVDYDEVWNKILDCYELSATIRDAVPFPFLIDPDGIAISELEKAENLLRKYFDKLEMGHNASERNKKVIQALIDILQNLRWLVMINDGLADKPGEKIYKDGKSLMASIGI